MVVVPRSVCVLLMEPCISPQTHSVWYIKLEMPRQSPLVVPQPNLMQEDPNQWCSQSLSGWASRPPKWPKWGRKSRNIEEKWEEVQWNRENWGKFLMLPTQECEAGNALGCPSAWHDARRSSCCPPIWTDGGRSSHYSQPVKVLIADAMSVLQSMKKTSTMLNL